MNVENMSVKMENTRLSVDEDVTGITNLDSTVVVNAEKGTILESEAKSLGNGVNFSESRNDQQRVIKEEIVDFNSVIILSSDTAPFADVASSTNAPPAVNVLSSAKFLVSETDSSNVAGTNIIIKKEGGLDSDENVSEAVIESHHGISTDSQGSVEFNRELFQTATTFDEASKIPASGLGLQVRSSSSDTHVQTFSMRCKSEEQFSFHLRKAYTHYDGSFIKVRDVRVVLVDILSKNSPKLSNISVNHIESESCVCVLCSGKVKLPERIGVVAEERNNGKSDELDMHLEKNCGKSGDEKWHSCAVCPARFIFAHNLERHSVMDHQVNLCLVRRVKLECDSDLEMHAEMHPVKEQYLCLFCSFKSEKEVDLEVHLKTHSGIKCFSCAKCRIEFQECHNLVKHIKEHYDETCKDSTPRSKITHLSQKHLPKASEKKVLSCTYCGAKFKFSCRLKSHMMQHTNEKPLACPHCPAKFLAPSFLKSHLVKHSSIRPFSCTICPAKFKRAEGLQNHLLIHETVKPYSCMYCDTKFRNKGYRNRHVKIHTEEKRYPCPHCDKKLSSSRALKRHCRIHMNEKPYACTHCPRKFRAVQLLNSHLQLHTNDVKLHSCEYCPAKFRHKDLIRLHLMNHTGERPYKCNHCGGTFKTKTQLGRHIVIHFEARPFRCGECDAAFKSAREVKQHRKTHSNEKPFKCDLCSAAFKTKWTLNLHKKIHTREALYTCEHCDLRFKTKQEILFHLPVHSVLKPHVCRHCSAEFKFKSRLIRHTMQVHSTKKPFVCTFCPAKFKLKECLNQHKKRHHSERVQREESSSASVGEQIKGKQV